MRSRVFTVLSALFCFTAIATTAGAAGPKAAHADIMNSQGTKVGSAKIKASGDGVKISVKVSNLSPGEHGIHIHTVGKCEAPDFKTAGGHFNPTSAHHGIHNEQDPKPHLGDLANLTVDQGGSGYATFTVSGVTLGDGANSLFHDGGTSLVIHAKADDMKSDPSGNSGDRVACGVIEK
ncbi:MAG TPA: superoxide dismutase family protein [Terracidiphilus sp.]